jgi:hypothetical protein
MDFSVPGGTLETRTVCKDITYRKQGVGRNIERHAEAHIAGTLQSKIMRHHDISE